MFFKRGVALFVLGVLLCVGIFAQNVTGLDGDAIDGQLQKYVKNISKLIPDSVTTQNMWSYVPRSTGGIFGGGVSASFTFAEQSAIAGTNYEEGGFSGEKADLSKFPDTIGFLPAVAFDLRFGGKNFDLGFMGMWADSNAIEAFAKIVGEGSHYVHRTIGLDFRYAAITDSIPRIFGKSFGQGRNRLIPSLTFQAGYFFTWMSLGFESKDREAIDMDFRSDAFFFSFQAAKRLADILTPFVGIKMIFAKTFSEYSWNTAAPVNFRGDGYEDGLSYKSGTKEGDFYTYIHFYGGVGITMLTLDATVGVSFNPMSEHFSVSVGARFMFR